MAAPRLLLLAAPLLLVTLSGCLGGDAEPQIETRGNFTQELAQGVPEKFILDNVDMAPAGVVKKERTCEERPFPYHYLPGFDCVVKWRVVWNITGLVPLGTGDGGGTLGETHYLVWLGKANNGQVDYTAAVQGAQPGKEGRLDGATTWQPSNVDYSAIKLTLQTGGGNQDITLMENADVPPGEEGEFPIAYVEPFEPAFGDAKVQTVVGEPRVTVNLSAFELPQTRSQYHAFLKNGAGERYLGTLQPEATSDSLILSVQVPQTDLAANWQIFIGLESADAAHQEKPSGLKVLVSRFKSG